MKTITKEEYIKYLLEQKEKLDTLDALHIPECLQAMELDLKITEKLFELGNKASRVKFQIGDQTF